MHGCTLDSTLDFQKKTDHGRKGRRNGRTDSDSNGIRRRTRLHWMHALCHGGTIHIFQGTRTGKSSLVNQSENSSTGPKMFTPPQEISGNMQARCNNCPSRGCADCPMYGVGKNPYFEKKEKQRKERIAKRKLKQQMESSNRSADL